MTFFRFYHLTGVLVLHSLHMLHQTDTGPAMVGISNALTWIFNNLSLDLALKNPTESDFWLVQHG